MPRVIIDLPQRLPFQTELTVRVSDVNFAGHLGHDAVVTLLHEARARLFRSLGGHELDIFGVGIILADLAVSYRAEAFAGDLLRAEIGAAEFGARSCDLVYRLTRLGAPGAATRESVEVARAKTGLVFFDYKERQAVAVPREFRAAFPD